MNTLTLRQKDFLAALDWDRIIPIILRLIEIIQRDGVPTNIRELIQLILELFQLLGDAEKASGVALSEVVPQPSAQFDIGIWLPILMEIIRFLLENRRG